MTYKSEKYSDSHLPPLTATDRKHVQSWAGPTVNASLIRSTSYINHDDWTRCWNHAWCCGASKEFTLKLWGWWVHHSLRNDTTVKASAEAMVSSEEHGEPIIPTVEERIIVLSKQFMTRMTGGESLVISYIWERTEVQNSHMYSSYTLQMRSAERELWQWLVYALCKDSHISICYKMLWQANECLEHQQNIYKTS